MHRFRQLSTVLALIMGLSPGAYAAPREEAFNLYRQFVAAQNAHDLAKVRALFLASPDFLWVSDGQSIWGVDDTPNRMALFQEADIWRVDPNLAEAKAITVDGHTAYLHLPLVLTIGPKAAPEKFGFLVTVLCVETEQGWRIAGLFTTTDKTP
jgi:ketosteroid isomerase-like protein